MSGSRDKRRPWRCAPPSAPTDDVFCAVHGDCLCTRLPDGGRSVTRPAYPACPLHGANTDSDHPHGKAMIS